MWGSGQLNWGWHNLWMREGEARMEQKRVAAPFPWVIK